MGALATVVDGDGLVRPRFAVGSAADPHVPVMMPLDVAVPLTAVNVLSATAAIASTALVTVAIAAASRSAVVGATGAALATTVPATGSTSWTAVILLAATTGIVLLRARAGTRAEHGQHQAGCGQQVGSPHGGISCTRGAGARRLYVSLSTSEPNEDAAAFDFQSWSGARLSVVNGSGSVRVDADYRWAATAAETPGGMGVTDAMAA